MMAWIRVVVIVEELRSGCILDIFKESDQNYGKDE
jgi:hypothetical protein